MKLSQLKRPVVAKRIICKGGGYTGVPSWEHPVSKGKPPHQNPLAAIIITRYTRESEALRALISEFEEAAAGLPAIGFPAVGSYRRLYDDIQFAVDNIRQRLNRKWSEFDLHWVTICEPESDHDYVIKELFGVAEAMRSDLQAARTKRSGVWFNHWLKIVSAAGTALCFAISWLLKGPQ